MYHVISPWPILPPALLSASFQAQYRQVPTHHGLPQGAHYTGLVRSLKAVGYIVFRQLATRVSLSSSIKEFKMSHLLLWPGLTYFYPLGNTSAVCLTESLPPEHNADMLLLGCGDPRHILYTVYADATLSGAGRQLEIRALCMCLTHPTEPRKLDVTCCDMEAAVLGTWHTGGAMLH